MASKIRAVKPEFFRHEHLHELEIRTGLPLMRAFCALWTICDREGRFRWRPNQIKLDTLPWDNVDIDDVLNALWAGDYIRKYYIRPEPGETEPREFFGYVPTWKKHQRPRSDEAKSFLPDPEAEACEHVPAPQLPAVIDPEIVLSRVLTRYGLVTDSSRIRDGLVTDSSRVRDGLVTDSSRVRDDLVTDSSSNPNNFDLSTRHEFVTNSSRIRHELVTDSSRTRHGIETNPHRGTGNGNGNGTGSGNGNEEGFPSRSKRAGEPDIAIESELIIEKPDDAIPVEKPEGAEAKENAALVSAKQATKGKGAGGTQTPVTELLLLRRQLHIKRYGVEPYAPQGNATINGMLSRLVKQVGKDEARQILAHYYTVPNKFYAEKAHDLRFMINDLSRLATEIRRRAPIEPDLRADDFDVARHTAAVKAELMRRYEAKKQETESTERIEL